MAVGSWGSNGWAGSCMRAVASGWGAGGGYVAAPTRATAGRRSADRLADEANGPAQPSTVSPVRRDLPVLPVPAAGGCAAGEPAGGLGDLRRAVRWGCDVPAWGAVRAAGGAGGEPVRQAVLDRARDRRDGGAEP